MGDKIPERVIAKLVAILVIFILLIIFAIQNFHRECAVRIFFWETAKTPISVIIFVSVLIGVIVASSELIPHLFRLRRRAREAEEQLARLKSAKGEARYIR